MKEDSTKHFRLALWLYIPFIFILAGVAINGINIVLSSRYILSIRLDYLTHFGIFIPLMWLIWNGYQVSFRKRFFNALAWVAAGLALGFLSEGIQYFIPYRAYNINDLAANLAGVLLGSLFFLFPVNQNGFIHRLLRLG